VARVLFVDDDPDTLETLTKAMQLFGHEAVLARSAAEALQLAAQVQLDVIFTDMMLPDMDGLDLVGRLHALQGVAQIPILVLSASPEPEMTRQAEAAGARAYINKPIRLQTLLDVIRDATAK
jgi:response regulator NasT